MNRNDFQGSGYSGQPQTPFEPPEWAISYASAALKTGMLVPEIEKRLVAKGLTPANAAVVLEGILAGRLRQPDPEGQMTQRWVFANRALSDVVWVGLVLAAYLIGDTGFAVKVAFRLVFPVGCIWFGAEVTQYMMGEKRDSAPSFFIRLLG